MQGFLQKCLAMKYITLCLFTALAVASVACGRGRAKRIDTTPVAVFDLDRYLGNWYEIARYNHRFERGMQQVRAEYILEAPGHIRVVNSGVDAEGKYREAIGKAHPGKYPGQLRVSFFWIFYADYNVLALDPAYRWALVGSNSPKYLWILSRTPTLPDTELEEILRQAAARGYDTTRLLYVSQDRNTD